jgi:hypothetical protein
MVSKTGRCYTPTSLWKELQKAKWDKVTVIICRKNIYDIDFVIVDKK